MKALVDRVSAVMGELIGSTVFDDPAGGTQAMRYYVGQMPDKRETGNEQDYPFCLTELGAFAFSREGRRQTVEVSLGMYEAGSKADALTMIDSLMALLADAPSKTYAGYKLLGEFTGTVEQNHPYYEVNLSGDFRKVK